MSVRLMRSTRTKHLKCGEFLYSKLLGTNIKHRKLYLTYFIFQLKQLLMITLYQFAHGPNTNIYTYTLTNTLSHTHTFTRTLSHTHIHLMCWLSNTTSTNKLPQQNTCCLLLCFHGTLKSCHHAKRYPRSRL